MTVRLYFLVPDEPSAVKIVTGLKNQDVPEDNIHAVADRKKYPLDDRLPEADMTERTDVVDAAKRGASVGGAAGLFAGLAAVAVTPLGLLAAGGALAATTLGGATFGTWVSTMIGVSVTNTDIDEFEEEIAKGQILMLVDVKPDRVDHIVGNLTRANPYIVIRSGVLEDLN